MKAASFSNKTISLIDKPLPQLNAGEILVKSVAAGICHTDIELFNGYYQFDGVAGHEFAGIVQNSPGQPEIEGKRVVADINCGCGACSWCRTGNQRHCPSRRVIGIRAWDGAFAEYLKVPLANVHLIGPGISDEQAVFAEPLAAALEISQQIHITNRHRMVVLGDGKLGLLAALALRHYSSGITLVGKHRNKLTIAEKQHINTFQVQSNDDLLDLPQKLGLFDIVIEATGKEDGICHALNLTRPEGTLVVKTTSRLPTQLNLARIVVDEINIVGSRCGDMALALSFLENEWLDVKPLIDAVYPFREFKKAFAHARSPGTKKIILRFDAP